MEQRVRIADIAEELGLSTATVSNVIHGKTNKISDRTVERVQALLEEKQYVPSMAALLLAHNDSKIIGVFVNDHEKYEGHVLEDAFIAASLNALSYEIEANGQFMMVKKAKQPEEIIQFASMWNMDGLVVIGFCMQDYRYLRSHMRIPFVIYDGICENPERMVNITIDNFHGGFQVGTLFKKTGHTKALCISDNNVGVDRARMQGFTEAFGQEGTSYMQIPMYKKERWDFYLEKIEAFRQVSAVFAVSDYYAIDLIHFLKEQGFRIPEQISVAGFDDIPLCEMFVPALTTVKQDSAKRAAVALEKLRELKENSIQETTIVLPVTLVERDSTRK